MPLEITDYTPIYIAQTVDAAPRKTITSERWNELWNLVISQGDYNTDAIVAMIAAVLDLVPMGEYNPATGYSRLNIVSYQGSSYIAKQNTTGNLPTNTTYWGLLAGKGDSVYQVWLAAGNVGTVQDFLNDIDITVTLDTDSVPNNSMVAGATTTDALNTLAGAVGGAVLTSDVTYYVDTTGDDANDGTAGTPFATVSKALSMLPKQFQGARATINIASGTYDLSFVVVEGFYGEGELDIYGATAPSKPVVNSLLIRGCSLNSVTAAYLDPDFIQVRNSERVTVHALKCDNRTVNIEDAYGCYVFGCEFINAPTCIYSNRNSYVTIASNYGSGNTKVLEANAGGTIVKWGNVGITGTTAETVTNGGLIR